MKLEKRFQLIQEKLKKYPNATLIAVSKKQTTQKIRELYELGQRDFAENYAQELIEKANNLHDLNIRWHFIGHLQSNKIKAILPLVSSIHSLTSMSHAQKISNALYSDISKKKALSIFVEIQLDPEKSKSGILPETAKDFCQSLKNLKDFQVEGLMCIPDPTHDPRLKFKQLATLSHELGDLTQGRLSMGMSGDYQTALQEGATHVRIGTALFGPR